MKQFQIIIWIKLVYETFNKQYIIVPQVTYNTNLVQLNADMDSFENINANISYNK